MSTTASTRAPGRCRRAAAGLGLVATLAALVGGEAVLWLAGAALPALPVDRASASRTLAETDPVALAAAVVRLVALLAGGGLLVVTFLGVAARCCGAARLVIRLDRWTPPSMRRVLDGAIGVGLAASIGLGAPAGADAGSEPRAATTMIRRLPDGPATTLRRLPDAPRATPPGPTLRRLPDAAAAALPTAGPMPGPAPGPVPAAAADQAPPATGLPPSSPPVLPAATPAAPPASGPVEVIVQPGASFWLLAEQHEAARLGRQPTEAEIGACWQELVAVNRHRLAVPDDPDLLFPGQRLTLPCP